METAASCEARSAPWPYSTDVSQITLFPVCPQFSSQRLSYHQSSQFAGSCSPAEMLNARSTMNRWIRWLFWALIVGLCVSSVYLGAIQIAQNKMAAPEAACLLLVFFCLGVLVGNYRRNRVLDEALQALVWASIALATWLHTRKSLWPTLWGLLALLSMWICWCTFKASREEALIENSN